jgi:hypothetical protein
LVLASALLAAALLIAGCDSGDPKSEYLPADTQATTANTGACAELAAIFPGFVNSGTATDMFTLNGTTYADSSNCDPLIFAQVDPDAQDLEVSMLWGYVGPPEYYASHMSIDLWGRTLGLTPGAKTIVGFGNAADAVNEVWMSTTTETCEADLSGGPIVGGVLFSAIGAPGGLVAGSFTAVPMVLEGTSTPCSTPSFTGSFSMTREADGADGGSGSVASPVLLAVGGGGVGGAITTAGPSSGSAWYRFVATSGTATIAVSGATADVAWQLYSSADFVTTLTYCDTIQAVGTESCGAGGLTATFPYYVRVGTRDGESTSFTISVN